MFYLISIGYGFGIRGLFTRHKDLSQWNPEQEVRPVLGVSLVLLLVSVVAYHVILLATGYREFGYTFGYAAAHLVTLLKTHNLWRLFCSRAVLGLLMMVVLACDMARPGERPPDPAAGAKGGNR